MEVCEHHKPFKELTSTQNGTPTERYPPYTLWQKKFRSVDSPCNLCGIAPGD